MENVFLNKNPLNVVMLNTAYLNGGYKKKLSDVDENGYIKFKDTEVSRVLAENFGDGIGTTLEQVKSVENIDMETLFAYNEKIESFDELELFEGLTEAPYAAFLACPNLKSLRLPNTITRIQNSFCRECPNLTSIEFPKGIVRIDDAACRFSPLNCELNLPNLTELGRTAFSNTGITKIVNLGNVTSLSGDSIFENCRNLTEAYIPNQITVIGAGLFSSCVNLKMDIPSQLVQINSSAFRNVTILNDLNLPFLQVAAANCFADCVVKKAVNLGVITELSSRMFQNSTIEECVLPFTIVTIGDSAFLGTKLTRIDLPASVANIQNYAFYNCKLETFICRAIVPPLCGYNIFNYAGTFFYVPDESVEAYKTASHWSSMANRIKPLSEYVE